MAPALAATLLLAACDQSPTEVSEVAADDYALLMFGEAGAALEGTMGAGPVDRPFDGSSAFHRLPENLRLTEEQIAAIQALREEFKTAHQAQIDSLKTIFQAARAAKEAGATREEVRAILEEGRAIAMAMRPDVIALHLAIWDLLTDAQRRWLRMHHRMHHMPSPIAGGGR